MKLLTLSILILAATLSGGCATSSSEPQLPEKTVVIDRVTSIYDADTFRVDIDRWPPIIGQRMSIRVAGIDAPELRGRCEAEARAARAAKQFTVEQLRAAKRIELTQLERGKYFRIIAEVNIDGKNLGKMLIERGLARAYQGGKRRSWCQ